MKHSGDNIDQDHDDGAIIVVAKCPIPGKSKTRLIPLLGESGSARFAKCMLIDILSTLVHCIQLQRIRKVLYYAPATDDGRGIMLKILNEQQLSKQVHMIPMLIGGDLQSVDLGDQLCNALQQAKRLTKGPIMFLGMDSPELPMDEIIAAFRHTEHATLCPCPDGGYGMLCVPNRTPQTIFSNILWSHPLTAICQLKALSDASIDIRIGRMMHDMDEPEDVLQLMRRASDEQHPLQSQSCLVLPSHRGELNCSTYSLTKECLNEVTKELHRDQDRKHVGL